MRITFAPLYPKRFLFVVGAPFTLMELLASIAIIAILACLLLPALGKAKETARRIGCANSEKQMAVALNMYVSDFSDWYPNFITPSTGTRSMVYWTYWFVRMNYLKSGRFLPSWGNFLASLPAWRDTSLRCPSRAPGPNCDEMTDYVIQSVDAWYGGGYLGVMANGSGCKVSQIGMPSLLVSFGESWSEKRRIGWDYVVFGDSRYWPSSIAFDPPSLTPWQHGKGSNYVFSDGHVEFIIWKNINIGFFNIRQERTYLIPGM